MRAEHWPEHYDQLAREAAGAYPQEAVWLITPGECRRVENVAPDPCATFRVAKRDMAAAHGRGLLAIVHSHPDGPDCPSEADMRGQAANGVPWGIISTNGEGCLPPFWWGDTLAPPPLVGRGFRHGVTDCYSLIRDYYRVERHVTLPEFPRSWEWWRSGKDLYRDGFGAAGFERIEPSEAQAGDVFLAQLRSPVPNHGGILLEGGLALHHKTSKLSADPTRLSMREPIARWVPYVTHWLRYTGKDD